MRTPPPSIDYDGDETPLQRLVRLDAELRVARDRVDRIRALMVADGEPVPPPLPRRDFSREWLRLVINKRFLR